MLRGRWLGARPEWTGDGQTFMLADVVKTVADLGHAQEGKAFLMTCNMN